MLTYYVDLEIVKGSGYNFCNVIVEKWIATSGQWSLVTCKMLPTWPWLVTRLLWEKTRLDVHITEVVISLNHKIILLLGSLICSIGSTARDTLSLISQKGSYYHDLKELSGRCSLKYYFSSTRPLCALISSSWRYSLKKLPYMPGGSCQLNHPLEDHSCS